MTWRGPTYRMVDGEKINGAWCHVWRRHGPGDAYHLEDLIVYADGTITCRDRTDLAGLGELLASGQMSVTGPDAPPVPDEPSKWLSRRGASLTVEGFLLEVADRVEELNGRVTARQACEDAIQRFQQDPTETNRGQLRQAYLAVPPHLRIYVLGDMDQQDKPLRILFTDVGACVDGDGPVVTAQMHQRVMDYFDRDAQGVRSQEERQAVHYADEPSGPGRPALVSHQTVYPRGWPEELGPFVLRNDYPAQIVLAGETYASVVHGYWALAAAEVSDRGRIREAESSREAHDLGGRAAHRPDWPDMRLAVMARLLHAKFSRHPELAAVLLATGDARISYTSFSDAPFWRDDSDDRGRNWMGRLLELTRSELLAQRARPVSADPGPTPGITRTAEP